MPTFILGALGFLKKHWQGFLIGALVLFCLHLNSRAQHWHDQTTICSEARKTDAANYAAASAKSSADNKATVLAVEHKWQDAAAKTDKEYNEKISSANASVAAYVDRMRQQGTATSVSSASSPGVPQVANPSGGSAGTGEGADIYVPVSVSDLNACAEGVTKAQSWQDYYETLTAAQPENKDQQ